MVVSDLRNPFNGERLQISAAYYGLVRRGKGIRIRGGVARSYYIGIESAMPAVPGMPAPLKALCVVPFGMEEGTEADIPGREFGMVVDPGCMKCQAKSTALMSG